LGPQKGKEGEEEAKAIEEGVLIQGDSPVVVSESSL
jgi:hypothetical protein